MEKACELNEKLIFAIGNAPTALIHLYELIKDGRIRPELVIGVPVGFVNVVQSKELILTLEDTPYIVATHECEAEAEVYAHGTHFVFPEGMLKTMLPVGSALFVKWAFPAAGKYPKECRETRKDIEKRMCRILTEWKDS